ncbi:MAG: GGDEF domain-containing protein [candidate division WOR-3 bacterium]|nr:MAG: GGDEF domain-containing protein [candidate division WOR-3 bacterium]
MKKKHKLLLVDCGKVIKQIPLGVTDILIGRAEDTDLTLTSNEVSRHHAAVRFKEKEYIIEDLSSTNGTFVNSHKVKRQTLNPGDEICIGEHSVIFDDGTYGLSCVEETEITRRGEETSIISSKFNSLESKIDDNLLRKEFRDIEKFVRKSRKRLATLAHADKLTGLYNRQYFDRTAPEEFRKARSANSYFSVLFVDLDRFKEVNDTYGHRTGDEVLRGVAWLIQRACRKTDLVARYGGEEIVIVLPKTRSSHAIKIAEETRLIIERQTKKILDVPITVSIGISTFPEDGSDLNSLLENADKALYEAKRSGRNRVVKYHE